MVIGEEQGGSGTPSDVNLEIAHVSAATTADHTLRLLGCIAGESRGTTAAELSRQLALPRLVTERICNGLLALGYVSRDLAQDRYVQGPKLRRLAVNALSGRELSIQRRGVLADLVTEVGETSNFTTIDGASVLYLDRVEAAWPWRLTLEAGAKVPMHCTASGKLFLAYMAEERRERFLVQTGREPLTPATIVSAEALRRECDEITKRGYALDREEFVPGLTAIAVPVEDAVGKVWGAISVHGPSGRMPVTEAVAKLPALLGAARRMADLL